MVNVARRFVGFVAVGFALAACAPPQTSGRAGAGSGAALEAAAGLQGTVFVGGAPAGSVLIQASAGGTTAVVASATTDGRGEYVLALAPGAYDFRLTAPPATGIPPQVVTGVAVADGGTAHDFILIAAASPRAISGTVRGLGGAPLPGLAVAVSGQGPASNGQRLATAVTDAAGAYAAAVAAGTYSVLVEGTGPAGLAPGGLWSFTRFDVTVGAATAAIADFDLPLVRLTGTVTDAAGAPLPGVAIHAGSSTFLDPALFWASQGDATTGPDGGYELLLFTGLANLTLQPPAGSGVLPREVFGIPLAGGDATFDVALPAATARLSGTLRGLDGAPLAGIQGGARDGATGVAAGGVTDAAGAYQFDVTDGTYGVAFQSLVPLPGLPQTWSYARDVAVAGDTVLDVDVPFVRVGGVVVDPDGNPVAGVAVAAHGFFSTSAASATSFDQDVTGADGRYALVLTAATASIIFRPPPGSPLVARAEGGVPIPTDTVHDVTLSAGVRITGVVRLGDGTPIPGAAVSARDTSINEEVATTVTAADGSYELAVAAARYELAVRPPGAAPAPTFGAPDAWTATSFVDVPGDATFDFTLPAVRLGGRVTTSDGAPVAGVALAAESQGSPFAASSSALSAADGSYTLFVLPEVFRFTVSPPAGGAFPVTILEQALSLGAAASHGQSIVLVTGDAPPPPDPPEVAAVQALAEAVAALPPRAQRPLAPLAALAAATVARAESALAAGDARRARQAFCAARVELGAFIAAVNLLSPRLIPATPAHALIQQARDADAAIRARMQSAGLRAC